MGGNSLNQTVNTTAYASEAEGRDIGPLLAHLDLAFNFAHWMLRDKAEAEDAVQEAYLRAMEHIHTFQGKNGRGWLLAILRNRCYDSMKRRAVGTHVEFNEEFQSPALSGCCPETSLLWREQTGQLTEALQNLPPRLRQVLILREFEEMPYNQIAAVLGIPIGTVMSRLSRARHQLREIVLSSRQMPETAVPEFHEIHALR